MADVEGEQGEIWYDATVQQHDERSGERTAGRPWSDTWQAGQCKTLERNVGVEEQEEAVVVFERNGGCGGSWRRLRVVSEAAQAGGTVYLNASSVEYQVQLDTEAGWSDI